MTCIYIALQNENTIAFIWMLWNMRLEKVFFERSFLLYAYSTDGCMHMITCIMVTCIIVFIVLILIIENKHIHLGRVYYNSKVEHSIACLTGKSLHLDALINHVLPHQVLSIVIQCTKHFELIKNTWFFWEHIQTYWSVSALWMLQKTFEKVINTSSIIYSWTIFLLVKGLVPG